MNIPSGSGPVLPATGRSTCPGAVAKAETNLTGPAADALERLQGAYEDELGFLAVVFDGTQPVVVVASDLVPAWEARLRASGVALARSCIEPALLADVQKVFPAAARPGDMAGAGYDALSDAIVVRGVDQDSLLNAIAQISDAAHEAAVKAIADGTLRQGQGRCR